MSDKDTPQENQLIDRFGRRVSYVRFSVTDRCDFRCVYCMAEDMQFLPRKEILSLEEISRLAQAFVDLGVDKIRITGGEPLVRRDILWLLHRVSAMPGLRELVLTTNGSQLEKYAAAIREAGVSRLNISLDSLQPQRFRRLTRVGRLEQVLRGIDAAVSAGFDRIKLNSVILRGRNDDEVLDLADFAIERGMDISFIEEMPLGQIVEHDRAEVYFSSDDVLATLAQRYQLTPTTETTGGPSRYYRVSGTNARIGLISPHSHNFCESCNRVRVTAKGRLLLCLGQEHSVDLRAVLREMSAGPEQIKAAIRQSMLIKPRGHDFDLHSQPVILRHMSVTGG